MQEAEQQLEELEQRLADTKKTMGKKAENLNAGIRDTERRIAVESSKWERWQVMWLLT